MNEESTNGEAQNADEVLPDEDLEQAAGGMGMFTPTVMNGVGETAATVATAATVVPG